MKKTNTRWFENKITVFIGLILVLNIVLRFFQLEQRLPFGWDQISNSWVMKTMFVDKKLPLLGMVAKGNSGFYIGPAYYYLLAPFYWLFQLDPIAGGVFVGLVSLITVIVLMYLTREMFGLNVSLFSGFLYTVSGRVIRFDRIPWPVNFIPLVSILIFYFLYQVMSGKTKYLIPLACTVGFAFHIHFTAIFFPIIVFLCLPFFIKQKNSIKYMLLSIPFFAVWLIPNVLSDAQAKSSSGSSLVTYLGVYFHGFHLRRVVQLIGDSLLEVESLIPFRNLGFLKYLFLPVYFVISYRLFEKKKFYIVTYLVVLWFLVPLLIFSTYKGELTDYYYSISRPLAPILVAIVLSFIWNKKQTLTRLAVCLYCVVFAYISVFSFYADTYTVMPKARKKAIDAVQSQRQIDFSDGDPLPYLYGMYWFQKTGTWR